MILYKSFAEIRETKRDQTATSAQLDFEADVAEDDAMDALHLLLNWAMGLEALRVLAINPNPHLRDKVIEDDDADMPASRGHGGSRDKPPPKPKKQKTWHDIGSEAVLEFAGVLFIIRV